VYIGSGDGRLYVLDLMSGKKLSEFDTGAGITRLPPSPQASRDRHVDGQLYVFG
jgi:hypothetical protein